MFDGRTILIGVSGGIAAYKMPYLVSALSKTEAEVHVLMTRNAANFVSPLVFETLSHNSCLIDTFDRDTSDFGVKHVTLAGKADVFMTAPATANFIAKAAHGIADDMLTTTFLAAGCHKIVVPAMNTQMFDNPATQDNIAALRRYGVEVTEPGYGPLACGGEGRGRMPEPAELFACLEKAAGREKDLAGKKVLVTAGATREALDPVRFISNHSTGRMGFAVAREAMMRGAQVTLIKAAATAEAPLFCDTVEAVSAEDMFREVQKRAADMDVIIKAAAVADYRPATRFDSKIKKKDGSLDIKLERTQDILAWLGEHKKKRQFLCGFSMETEDLIGNSVKKLKEKQADMIVANDLSDPASGFGTDTNRVTFITPEGVFPQELKSKEEVAADIWDRILACISRGR